MDSIVKSHLKRKKKKISYNRKRIAFSECHFLALITPIVLFCQKPFYLRFAFLQLIGNPNNETPGVLGLSPVFCLKRPILSIYFPTGSLKTHFMIPCLIQSMRLYFLRDTKSPYFKPKLEITFSKN